jgi:hypothetical protein
VPSAHGPQTDIPVLEAVFPFGHIEQTVDPIVAANFPVVHGSHFEKGKSPVEVKLDDEKPFGQETHFGERKMALKRPGTQSVQDMEFFVSAL